MDSSFSLSPTIPTLFYSLDTSQKEATPPADILFLIVHGGSIMDARVDQVGQSIDFQTFSQNIRNIIDLHFHSAFGRIALRVIPCPNICSGALNMLCEVRGNYSLTA